ncbi:hypothetical protein Lal_00033383 [Lupinus albus]|nr:hypothetical protein Lal_00033383 [Lupinus albus]
MRGEQRVRGEQRARVEQQVRREQYGRGQQRESGHSGSFNQQQIFKASTTFFFTNFPPDHGAKEMWEIFSKWGKVVDVVIPSRVDKYGKNLDSSDSLTSPTANSLWIWIGSFKIWVNIPKYRSGSVGVAKQSPCDNRKFVDVVKSGRSPSPTRATPKQTVVVVFKTSDDTPLWLRNSFFGIVADHVDPGTLKEKLFRDGFLTIHLTPLGGRSFLLRSEEDDDIEAFLEGEPAWFQSRFCVLRKWVPKDLASERFIWVRCYGVPLHAWEENFFKLLASSLGTFLGLDHWTRSHHHLEYGRFLVAIPFLASVDKSCLVRIDNIDYEVKLVEEKAHCWHQCGKTSSSILTTNSSTSDFECSWLDRDPLGCPQDWATEVEDDDVAALLERELDSQTQVGGFAVKPSLAVDYDVVKEAEMGLIVNQYVKGGTALESSTSLNGIEGKSGFKGEFIDGSAPHLLGEGSNDKVPFLGFDNSTFSMAIKEAKTVGPTTIFSAMNIGNGPLDFEFSNAINVEISVDPTTTIPSAPFSKEDPTLDFCKAYILSSGDLDKSLMNIPSLTDIINVEIKSPLSKKNIDTLNVDSLDTENSFSTSQYSENPLPSLLPRVAPSNSTSSDPFSPILPQPPTHSALGPLFPIPTCPSLKPLPQSSSIPQLEATTMYKRPQMIHNHQTRKHSPSHSLPSSNPPNHISKHRPVAHKKSVRFKHQCPESISKKYPKEFELWVDLRDLLPIPSSFKPQTCTLLHDTDGGALGPIGSSSSCKQRTSLEPIRPTSRVETDMDVREFGRSIGVVDASDKKSDNLNIALLPPNKQAGTNSQKAVNGIDSQIRMDEPIVIP